MKNIYEQKIWQQKKKRLTLAECVCNFSNIGIKKAAVLPEPEKNVQ